MAVRGTLLSGVVAVESALQVVVVSVQPTGCNKCVCAVMQDNFCVWDGGVATAYNPLPVEKPARANGMIAGLMWHSVYIHERGGEASTWEKRDGALPAWLPG